MFRILGLPVIGGVIEWTFVIVFSYFMSQQCAQYYPDLPKDKHKSPLEMSIILGGIFSLMVYMTSYLVVFVESSLSLASFRTRHLIYIVLRWSIQYTIMSMQILPLTVMSFCIEIIIPIIIGVSFIFYFIFSICRKEISTLDQSYKDTIA